MKILTESPLPTDSPLRLSRPDKIELLSRTYRIVWHSEPFPATDDELVQGECLNRAQELHINWEAQPSTVVEVLLHEVSHALYHMWGGEGVERDEEDFVNTITITQVTIMRQNPKLWRWMLDMLEAS